MYKPFLQTRFIQIQMQEPWNAGSALAYLVASGAELKTVSARCRSSSGGGMLSGHISFDRAEFLNEKSGVGSQLRAAPGFSQPIGDSDARVGSCEGESLDGVDREASGVTNA